MEFLQNITDGKVYQ